MPLLILTLLVTLFLYHLFTSDTFIHFIIYLFYSMKAWFNALFTLNSRDYNSAYHCPKIDSIWMKCLPRCLPPTILHGTYISRGLSNQGNFLLVFMSRFHKSVSFFLPYGSSFIHIKYPKLFFKVFSFLLQSPCLWILLF